MGVHAANAYPESHHASLINSYGGGSYFVRAADADVIAAAGTHSVEALRENLAMRELLRAIATSQVRGPVEAKALLARLDAGEPRRPV